MELALSPDQTVLAEAFGQFFRRESPSAVVRRAEPLGFDRTLWAALNTMEVWGSDATLSDLCVIAEAAGRWAAPVPFAEHAVASRMLGWPSLRAGETIGAFAPRASDDRGVWRVVPAGAVADVVVGFDRDEFVAITSPPPMTGPRNHASAPLSDRSARLGRLTVLGDRAVFERASAEWKVLTAAMLVGLSVAALEMAVEYVQQRHQFGVPIGSFQAVQHALADLPGRIDGARLLTHQAAAALDNSEPGSCDVANNDITDPYALASMALLFCGETAAEATARSLHCHGGYGFAEEYDIQLYYRRARGWALVQGDPAIECHSLADRLWPIRPADFVGGD